MELRDLLTVLPCAGRRPGQAQAGEADTEERPAPFVEHDVDAAAPRQVDSLDDLTGGVARAGERGGELGMCRSSSNRRREPENGLARGVEPVLKAPKCRERLIVLEQLGGACDRLQAGKRLRKPCPELPDLGSVALPQLSFGRHGAILAGRSIEYDRRGMDAPAASVLVVEDDAALRMVCRVNLELDGFRVIEAATADEARAAVIGERPGLVLLDLHLGSGLSDELLDELRAAGIPVVLVSGTVDVAVYEGRANAVVPKPFEPAELVDLARQHVAPVG